MRSSNENFTVVCLNDFPVQDQMESLQVQVQANISEGTVLLAALLGSASAFIVMAGILLVQALFFRRRRLAGPGMQPVYGIQIGFPQSPYSERVARENPPYLGLSLDSFPPFSVLSLLTERSSKEKI